MVLYQNLSGELKEIKEKPFKLEKDIQKIFEANLSGIMGLQLIRSEFIIKNKRIDTLAFDTQSCAFIIIEYKRDKNNSVVDQGFTYLGLMLENKADFIVEYNESLNKNLKREDVDWSQTRVVFVSPSFTDNQIQAANFKDLGIELWEVKQYENDTIAINQIKKSAAAESIKPIVQKSQSLRDVTAEIIVYTEQDHLEKAPDALIELYEKFKLAILNLADDIEIKPQKHYISFKKGNKTISDILIHKRSLKLFVNAKAGQLDDPKNFMQDVSNIGHLGNGHYQAYVEDDANLEYIMSLVKQVL
jgi:predicted transport protein